MQDRKIQEIYCCADNLLNKHRTKPIRFSSLEVLASKPLELNESIKIGTAVLRYSFVPQNSEKWKTLIFFSKPFASNLTKWINQITYISHSLFMQLEDLFPPPNSFDHYWISCFSMKMILQGRKHAGDRYWSCNNKERLSCVLWWFVLSIEPVFMCLLLLCPFGVLPGFRENWML